MFSRFFSLFQRLSFLKKVVSFFGALGIIASTILSVNQLISLFHEDKEASIPVVLALNNNIDNTTTNQRDQSSSGNGTVNKWVNEKNETRVYQGNTTITQGNQSSIGNGAINTWNNSVPQQRTINNEQ